MHVFVGPPLLHDICLRLSPCLLPLNSVLKKEDLLQVSLLHPENHLSDSLR
uniref:Uncharacterized protein n=1 Tax=Arundo donax TaxID=35708 RepID=A0A0A9EDZ3_ARUDO